MADVARQLKIKLGVCKRCVSVVQASAGCKEGRFSNWASATRDIFASMYKSKVSLLCKWCVSMEEQLCHHGRACGANRVALEGSDFFG